MSCRLGPLKETSAEHDARIARFLQLLKTAPAGAVFNPWWQADWKNDLGTEAPRIRRRQLRAYLAERCGTARLALIGEALGYRGGHFTGIAMTSERILLGQSRGSGIAQRQVLSTIAPRQTSNPDKHPNGFSEPTASIVWSTLLGLGLAGDQFVLWNAFPWHSFDPRIGLLSNRAPSASELAAGEKVLRAFLQLFPVRRIAVGRLAFALLKNLGACAECVRHPASGGASAFRSQIAPIVRAL